MMAERTEAQYFSARERQERALAMRCEDVAARRVHLDLAERYRLLAGRLVAA